MSGRMPPPQRDACLARLEGAESIMEAAGDLPGLSRLALVIDCLRAEHGLPARTAADLQLDFGAAESAA